MNGDAAAQAQYNTYVAQNPDEAVKTQAQLGALKNGNKAQKADYKKYIDLYPDEAVGGKNGAIQQ